ncbi:DUF6328 family protein [Kitasatospora sp. NPDC094015]|uniref:DUF6328 family protein n=1 Tax=Kitasatospora sp. NPDC094015 TaxID=3155205 RepID=UPI0033289028
MAAGTDGPPPARGRDETPDERADRQWVELLQEIRIAQNGAQIMFGFLLTLAFTGRFPDLIGFDRGLYVAAVTLGAFATGTLIAPVTYHRILAGRHLKPRMVAAVSKLVTLGVGLLALTVGSTLLLVLRVAGLEWGAWVVTGVVLLWFAVSWLILPTTLLRGGAPSRGRG